MNLELENKLTIKTRQELRQWLDIYGKTEKVCWVPVTIKSQPDTLMYLDVVEEALCFGWIDSTKKKIGTEVFQRLSPRRKNSNWTELNKERVRRLEKLGLMTDDGRLCLPNMSEEAFEIHPIILAAFKEEEPSVYKNFLAFPKVYQRIRIDTIQSCLKEKNQETFDKRLDKFLKNTANNQMYGPWHDEGRLLGD